MAQPPSTPHLSRSLVRLVPFAAQKEFNQVVTAAATLVASFEIGSNVTDRNQLGTSPAPTGTFISATGPLLDYVLYWDGGGAAACTVTVAVAIGLGAGVGAPVLRTIASVAAPKTTPQNVSGLRITGRYVQITFSNTSGADTTVTEFGVYLRSS